VQAVAPSRRTLVACQSQYTIFSFENLRWSWRRPGYAAQCNDKPGKEKMETHGVVTAAPIPAVHVRSGVEPRQPLVDEGLYGLLEGASWQDPHPRYKEDALK
jgi:hypothetical protein